MYPKPLQTKNFQNFTHTIPYIPLLFLEYTVVKFNDIEILI